MLFLNIVIALVSIYLMLSGLMLGRHMRTLHLVKESIIGYSLAILYAICLTRALLLIQVGGQQILISGLLLNYYLFLGAFTIQALLGHIIIRYIKDITKRTEP